MVLKGDLEFGLLIAFIQLVNYLSFPFQELPRLMGQIRSGTAAAVRVLDLLDVPQERTGGIRGSLDVEPLIELRHVTFTYPETPRPQLRDVSFRVARGQKVALVGASGSGKSTVIRLLTGQYEPQAGEVRVGGAATSEWSLEALRSTMAVVDQEAFLFDDTIKANVASGRLDASGEEIAGALEAAQCSFASDLPHGTESEVGEAGGSLSGGQRQRIALARALVRDAPILLLDEATSALDNQLEQQVYAAITAGPPAGQSSQWRIGLPRSRTLITSWRFATGRLLNKEPMRTFCMLAVCTLLSGACNRCRRRRMARWKKLRRLLSYTGDARMQYFSGIVGIGLVNLGVNALFAEALALFTNGLMQKDSNGLLVSVVLFVAIGVSATVAILFAGRALVSGSSRTEGHLRTTVFAAVSRMPLLLLSGMDRETSCRGWETTSRHLASSTRRPCSSCPIS